MHDYYSVTLPSPYANFTWNDLDLELIYAVFVVFKYRVPIGKCSARSYGLEITTNVTVSLEFMCV